MNTSHFHTHGWASGSSTATTHAGFSEVHQHLDDNSHLFDEMIQSAPHVPKPQTALSQQPKAKVLFQFFDGWPMAGS